MKFNKKEIKRGDGKCQENEKFDIIHNFKTVYNRFAQVNVYILIRK